MIGPAPIDKPLDPLGNKTRFMHRRSFDADVSARLATRIEQAFSVVNARPIREKAFS
jgi:hypothetical protein